MPFSVGHNVSGYVPESDVHSVRTFEEAKAILLSELKFAEDYAESETVAEEMSAAAEDMNLWSSPDTLYTRTTDSEHDIPTAWWITELSNTDYFAGNVPTDENDQPIKYAWPGGYEVFYIADDGGVICADCLLDETNPAHADPELSDGWRIDGYDHTGNTDAEVICDHCGRIIQEA